jgi:RNA polymerase sigma factor for flagellar operon FliA
METLARDRLIADHLYFTGALAENVMSEFNLHDVVEPDDVRGYAKIGLTEAASRYSPDKGATFETFSFRRIRGAVIDGLRKSHRSRGNHLHYSRARHEPWTSATKTHPVHGIVVRADQSVDDLPGADTSNPEAFLEAIWLRHAVLRAVRDLPALDAKVILLFYFEDLDLARIADRLGHTESYIGRVRLRALRQLERSLADVADDFCLRGSR